jgi:hypothetical protein
MTSPTSLAASSLPRVAASSFAVRLAQMVPVATTRSKSDARCGADTSTLTCALTSAKPTIL